MSAAELLGNLIFSGIGLAAFTFGRRQARLKTALFGILLMIYPWFVSDAIVLYVVGIILTVCLFTFTD